MLVLCHAGCDYTAVVDALGLPRDYLFDDPRGTNYRYDNNRLVGRTPDKRFIQANTDAQPELYRLSEVKAAVAEGRTVYVVEGEQDADVLADLGHTATTNPMGAGSWSQVDPTPLAGADVVIVADNDKTGMAHAAEVAASLRQLTPPATVTVVKAAQGKDATDHVLAGYGVEDFVPVDVAKAGPRLKVITASQVQERRVAYVWDGRIPIGSPTLMPGEEGIGKTTVGVRIMADLTQGTLSGEFHGEARDVVVMAPEDGLEDVVKPRFREAGADLDRVHFVISRQEGEDEDSVILPRDLPLLTDVIRQVDAALVWVDSLVTVLPDELKTISYKDVAKAMKEIGSWTEAQRVALVAPWHLNKNAGGDTALRMMDSRAFRTAVRSLLLIVADPDAEEGGPQQGIVALDKANAGTLNVPGLRYRIRSAHYTVSEVDRRTGELVDRPASCGVAEWIGQVEGDGRAIARAALVPKIDKQPTAQEWLSNYLAARGETLRQKVLDDGAEAGFKRTAITTAAGKIPVHSREEKGQDNGVPYRRSYWSLAPRLQSSGRSPGSVDSRTTRTTRTTGETPGRTTRSISPGQGQWSGSSGSSADGADRTTEPDDWTTRRRTLVGKSREEITEVGRALRERVLASTDVEEDQA
ncbi:AAA family ATPase [Geodermatophilus sp. URMC 60]